MTMTDLHRPRHTPSTAAGLAGREKAKSETGAVGKAVLLLRIIARSMEPATLSLLAREAMLAKSTVHRLLRILESEGVIFRVGTSYRMTQNVLGMKQELDTRDKAMPAMLRIYEATHLLVQLMVLEDDVVRCVEHFDSGLVQVRAGADRGATWLAADTAAGQALLASRQLRCAHGALGPACTKVYFDRGITHPGWATAAVSVLRENHALAAVCVTGPFQVVARQDVVSAMAKLGVVREDGIR